LIWADFPGYRFTDAAAYSGAAASYSLPILSNLKLRTASLSMSQTRNPYGFTATTCIRRVSPS